MNTMLRSRGLPIRELIGGRMPRLPPPRRPRPRTVIVLMLALAALLVGGYLWLRDSSLVSIRTVTVVGASGRDAGAIRRALIGAARRMTTLDVNMAALRAAVAPYTEVKGLHVSTEFPHGVRIVVVEEYAVAVVNAGGRQLAVAPDGMVLRNAGGQLPALGAAVPPGTTWLTARPALNELAVLAAAPYQFIPRIAEATEDASHGVVLQLRSGPAVYFGDTSRLAAKWRALVDVLAQPGSGGATYIDVSQPRRPAAGGGVAAAQAAIAAGLAQTGTSAAAAQSPAGTSTGTPTGTATGTATGTSIGTATGTSTGTATGTSTGTATGASTAGAAASATPAGTATGPTATGSTTSPTAASTTTAGVPATGGSAP